MFKSKGEEQLEKVLWMVRRISELEAENKILKEWNRSLTGKDKEEV